MVVPNAGEFRLSSAFPYADYIPPTFVEGTASVMVAKQEQRLFNLLLLAVIKDCVRLLLFADAAPPQAVAVCRGWAVYNSLCFACAGVLRKRK